MKSIKKIWEEVKISLQEIHEEREASAIAFILLEDLFGFSRSDILIDKEVGLNYGELESAIKRLQDHEPIQHVTGKADFFGRRFSVNSSTLIPRPETEELIQLIIDDWEGKKPTILDIGTGTGCIPITLSLELKTDVYGSDVSTEALAIADKNNVQHQSEVEFIHHDILKSEITFGSLDVIVSNPPYIPIGEKESMDVNVVGFEPPLALFVPQDEPLLFYRAIAEKAKGVLNKNGKLYFEVHESFGQQTKKLLSGLGYLEVTVFQDMQGKDRMVRARVA